MASPVPETKNLAKITRLKTKEIRSPLSEAFLPTMGKFEHKVKINECDKLKYIEMLIHVFINYLNLIGHI